MKTTITLPDDLSQQLHQQAVSRKRSAEALAIEYIAAALTEEAATTVEVNRPARDDDAELLALVARVKAMPPNPQNTIPAKGNLADVLRAMAHGEPDQEVLDALVAAELELRAMDKADDIAEGRG
jgi:predicted transcriptional regulator